MAPQLVVLTFTGMIINLSKLFNIGVNNMYSQNSGRFYSTGFDDSDKIDVRACAGKAGSCRNNATCQCESMIKI